MEKSKLLISEGEAGKRIDVVLADSLKDASRSYVQKLIDDGLITVNVKNIKSNYKLKTGDVIDIIIPEPENIDIAPKDMPLDVLYEDEDVIVINKPQGMVVHPAPGHFDDTLVNALMFRCEDGLSGINGKLRPGIVHRIDRDTSGVIMAAKNDLAHRHLAKQLSAHTIVRRYIAIVYGSFSEDEGSVNAPIGRNPKDRKKMCVTSRNSRNAVTHYKVIERLGRFTFLSLRLETGRTHQIRVHMAHINHPVLGDPVYGPKKCPFKLSGQALHAELLGFIHPRTGEYMEFKAETPLYFTKILNKLREG